MADTHQSNQYNKLVRRIGYSVGLEDLLVRVDKLVNIYVENRDINIALWKKLVKEEYGRKTSDEKEIAKWGGSKKTTKKLGAEDHFADFYSELNLISRKGNQIYPLYGLEILSILKRIYFDSEGYYLALKGLLLLFILEADGDIFINCLLGGFDKENVRTSLIKMFKEKRLTYQNVFLSQFSQDKLSSLFRVQRPLSQDSIFERRTHSVDEIEIPEDYLSKVIPTRKGWALQLDLFTNEMEALGSRLLEFLKKEHISNDGYAAFYSYSDTHKSLFIDESKTSIYSIDRKLFIREYFVFFFSDFNINPNRYNTSEMYNVLLKIMELYKSGNKVKGVIRHQLPFQVLFPVFYIISALDNRNGDLDSFIKEQQKSLSRKLDVLHLRGNEMQGALTFRS